MTKDDAINILLDHLSAGLVRSIENAIAKKEREAILDLVDGYAKNNTDLVEAIRARGQE